MIDQPSDNEPDPRIDTSPLTPEETEGLFRVIWEHGTDEERELLRRAGYDYGEESA